MRKRLIAIVALAILAAGIAAAVPILEDRAAAEVKAAVESDGRIQSTRMAIKASPLTGDPALPKPFRDMDALRWLDLGASSELFTGFMIWERRRKNNRARVVLDVG